MLTQALDTTADSAVALLIHYSFELGNSTADELIDDWLKHYPAAWLYLAVIEALYQGRYKAISVDQILALWYRRGQAAYHFNHEFERLVCGNLPHIPIRQAETQDSASPSFEEGKLEMGNSESPLKIRGKWENGKLGTPTQWGLGAMGRAKDGGKDQLRSPTPVGSSSFSTSLSKDDYISRNPTKLPQSLLALSPSSDKSSFIKRFTPPKDDSDFYTKLKAIAQQSNKGE